MVLNKITDAHAAISWLGSRNRSPHTTFANFTSVPSLMGYDEPKIMGEGMIVLGVSKNITQTRQYV